MLQDNLQPIELNELNLFLLMYADDAILEAESLQKLLD